MKSPKSLFGRKRGPIEFKPKEETKPIAVEKHDFRSDRIHRRITRKSNHAALALALLLESKGRAWK